jgi:hypothetical protein
MRRTFRDDLEAPSGAKKRTILLDWRRKFSTRAIQLEHDSELEQRSQTKKGASLSSTVILAGDF